MNRTHHFIALIAFFSLLHADCYGEIKSDSTNNSPALSSESTNRYESNIIRRIEESFNAAKTEIGTVANRIDDRITYQDRINTLKIENNEKTINHLLVFLALVFTLCCVFVVMFFWQLDKYIKNRVDKQVAACKCSQLQQSSTYETRAAQLVVGDRVTIAE
ncbi:MAG: hypothetical protein WCR46_20505 [Deltaproteobacteria bacterium]|jgi:hypothetical protein